jgi:hypothetical protein
MLQEVWRQQWRSGTLLTVISEVVQPYGHLVFRDKKHHNSRTGSAMQTGQLQ